MKLFEIASQEFDEDQFERDCAFYLKQMGKNAKSLRLYRGMKDTEINDIKSFRERSHPKDTPMDVHNSLNKFFSEKFNQPYRNGLFATGGIGTAAGYGEGGPKVVVPVGNFEWLCCPDIHDIYGKYAKMRNEYGPKNAAAYILTVAKTAKWKHSEKLPLCIKSRAEIMLWCPNGYYVFDPEVFLPRTV